MRHLAIVACLAMTGSAASAEPARRGHRHHKVHAKAKHRVRVAPPVALAPDETDVAPSDELVDAPVKLRERAPRAQDWNVAIGPYLWASSVDAKVSIGSSSVASSADFFQTSQHAKYGVEMLGEARYGRISIAGDVMYGVVGIDGAKDVGPLMVSLDGTASSLLADGFAGFRLAGDDQSLLSLEARGGVRYQRTAVEGSLAVGGTPVTSQQLVDGGADALAGARVFVRPSSRFAFAGTFDVGVFGSSTKTWSASADGSVRATKHVLVSLGWRTLTMNRGYLSMVMHGPRIAVQLLF